jgi:transglutaminase/protease-like cytokinesis protein 3
VFLTLSLLRSLDIPSRFVEGVANGQNHAWVEAKINGDWLIMDPTWGSGYIDPNNRFIKHYDKSFFDISKKKLAKTHKRKGVVY